MIKHDDPELTAIEAWIDSVKAMTQTIPTIANGDIVEMLVEDLSECVTNMRLKSRHFVTLENGPDE